MKKVQQRGPASIEATKGMEDEKAVQSAAHNPKEKVQNIAADALASQPAVQRKCAGG